jgi:hypothetical protein
MSRYASHVFFSFIFTTRFLSVCVCVCVCLHLILHKSWEGGNSFSKG